MSTIQVGGQLQPGTVDTPLDARARVDTVSAVAEIPLPFIGMTFFVKETGKLYVVKSLKSRQIGPVVTENAAIDEYEELPRTWEELPDKPETFPPEDHEHTTGEITGLDEALAEAGARPATIALPVPGDADNDNVTLVVDFSTTGEFIEEPVNYTRVKMSDSYEKMRVFCNDSWEAVPGPSLGVPYQQSTVEFTLDQELFPGYVAGNKYYARFCWVDASGNASDWQGFSFRTDVAIVAPVIPEEDDTLTIADNASVSGAITLDYLNGEVQNLTLTADATLSRDSIANVPFGRALIATVSLSGHTLTVNATGTYTATGNKTYIVTAINFGELNIIVTETV